MLLLEYLYLKFWVRNMCFLEPKRHRTNKSFKLWWFSGEVLSDEGDLCDHPLPALPPRLSRLEHFEHVGLGLRLDGGDGHLPLTSLLLTLLFNHTRDILRLKIT